MARTYTKAQEDFVETLLMLENNGEPLETTRVAKKLGISKPAVHQMGHELIDKGLITRKDYGDMKLTKAGRALAEEVLHRHKILKEFLLAIGVEEAIAEEDCCQIEHVISESTFQTIEAFVKNRK